MFWIKRKNMNDASVALRLRVASAKQGRLFNCNIPIAIGTAEQSSERTRV